MAGRNDAALAAALQAMAQVIGQQQVLVEVKVYGCWKHS